MLEKMFAELERPEALKHATRVLRFYHLLCCSGLRIRRGWYGGCSFRSGHNGGWGIIDIEGGLRLTISVFMGENEHVEFGVTTKDSDDDLTLFHNGDDWILCYTKDGRHPNSSLERIANLFGAESDGEEPMDMLRLRSFLREISLLTVRRTSAELSAPA